MVAPQLRGEASHLQRGARHKQRRALAPSPCQSRMRLQARSRRQHSRLGSASSLPACRTCRAGPAFETSSHSAGAPLRGCGRSSHMVARACARACGPERVQDCGGGERGMPMAWRLMLRGSGRTPPSVPPHRKAISSFATIRACTRFAGSTSSAGLNPTSRQRCGFSPAAPTTAASSSQRTSHMGRARGVLQSMPVSGRGATSGMACDPPLRWQRAHVSDRRRSKYKARRATGAGGAGHLRGNAEPCL